MKKKINVLLSLMLVLGVSTACTKDNKEEVPKPENPVIEKPIVDGEIPENEENVLSIQPPSETPNNEESGSLDEELFPKDEVEAEPDIMTLEKIALEVMNGDWGTGADRDNKLTAAGYNYLTVQEEINRIKNVMVSSTTKPVQKPSVDKPVVPSKPGTPNKPTTPTKPVVPPVKPTEPTKPTEPVKPVVPPVKPTEPVKPVVPPVKPTEPVKPVVPPVKPTEPTKPVVPPVKPTEPTKPVDTQAPVITVLGETIVSVKFGEKYVDKGVTVSDNVDKNLTAEVVIKKDSKVVDSVDTKSAGLYIIYYNVKDKAGNIAKQEMRRVTVLEQALTIKSVSTIKDISVAYGAKLILPAGVDVTLNNDEVRLATITWTGTADTTKPGVYNLTGSITLSNIEKTELTAKVKVTVREQVVQVVIPKERIVLGNFKVRDIEMVNTDGLSTLSLNYVINREGFITGLANTDLEAQPTAQNKSGIGHYSVSMKTPNNKVTHLKWETSKNNDPTTISVGTSEVETFNGNTGKVFYQEVAREIDANKETKEGTGNWIGIPNSEYSYRIEWFEGNPSSGGILVGMETLNVDVKNNVTLSPEVNPLQVANEFRKIRKTQAWLDTLISTDVNLDINEAGFFNPFVNSESEVNPGHYKVFFYNELGVLVGEENLIEDPLQNPLQGSTQEALDNVNKTKFWFSNLYTIEDDQPMLDANLIGSYSPFRIAFDEREANLGEDDYLIFFYTAEGKLSQQTGVLVEDVIMGADKEEQFLTSVKNMQWYRIMKMFNSYENAELFPSVYTIGAYEPFISETDLVDENIQAKVLVYYYDKTGKLISRYFILSDTPIPEYGTIEDIEAAELAEKNAAWLETIGSFPGGEDDSHEAYNIGSYVLFRMMDDTFEDPKEFKVYYYTPDRVKHTISGMLVDDIDIKGDQGYIDNTGYSNFWWNTDITVVDSLLSPEATVQQIGAYSWFKSTEDEAGYKHKYEFKAYYYSADKVLHTVEGLLDIPVDSHGTFSEMQATVFNSQWLDTTTSFSGNDDSHEWYYVGAYKWFQLESDNDNDYARYKAYYYTAAKELVTVEGTLVDEIVINGTEEQMILATKDAEWYNAIPTVNLGTKEQSWLSQGAFKWFKITEDEAILDEGHYKAYYFTDDKQLRWFEGILPEVVVDPPVEDETGTPPVEEGTPPVGDETGAPPVEGDGDIIPPVIPGEEDPVEPTEPVEP